MVSASLPGLTAAENVALPLELDGVSARRTREAGLRVLGAMGLACKRGVAVVVTHDAQLASWADRVVLIRYGRIVEQTAPAPGPESLLWQDR